jgi:large subunit ribosomal protein L24e
MVTKRKCSFCGGGVKPGTGKMVVALSGAVSFFCSSKCEKNALGLKRSPRKVRWTQVYQKEKLARGHKIEEKKPGEEKPAKNG